MGSQLRGALRTGRGPRTTSRCVGLAALAVVALSQPRSPHAAAGDAPTATRRADVERRVDGYLEAIVESGLFSGTVLVASRGEIVLEKAYGMADIEHGVANTIATRFKLMSVTKSITAVTVMRLVEQKRLGLDDPVGSRLDEWPTEWASVKVRHLLDHTSGIPNLEGEWVSEERGDGGRGLKVWGRLAPKLSARTLDTPAGANHAYSNFNYVLLGLLVEAVTNRSYADVVKAEVFDRVGAARPGRSDAAGGQEGAARMADSGFDDGSARPRLAVGYFRGRDGVPEPRGQDMSEILAAGGAISTCRDLYRLDRALRDDSLLAGETRARMVTPAPNTYGYALGWSVRPVHGHRCVQHAGGANGYVADFLRFPDDDACVIVLSNFAFAPVVVLGEDLAALLFAVDLELPASHTKAELDAYAGWYAGPTSTIVVRRSGRALVSYDVQPSEPRVAGDLLIPRAADRFARQRWPSGMRFERSAVGGAVGALRMDTPSGGLAFARVDPPSAAWRAAVGTYRRRSGTEAPLRIEATKGGFALEQPTGWGPALELVPVSETLAVALYGEDFGTLVRVDRERGQKPSALHWTRNDGTVVDALRASR